MMIISSTTPGSSVLLPCARVLLRPLLWVRNLRGKWRSRRDADPAAASRDLGKVDAKWRRKINTVLSSPDNAVIPRVPEAGQLAEGLVTMHNGIRVSALGYYGGGILNMLVENRGVHEPQEERAFADILPRLRPGATMIELGAYWGFYSLWFARDVRDARCHLVEPDQACLLSGQGNFARSGVPATFTQAYVGAVDGVTGDGTDILSVDGYCAAHAVERLDILHSDIQGAEADMLRGASRMLGERRVDYVFISTHSNDLHAECVRSLESHGYRILASANLDDSYSGDGLIVARGPHVNGPDSLPISLRSRDGAANAR